jgi:hypothetical protein
LQKFTVPVATAAGFDTVAVSVTIVPATTVLLGAIVRVVAVTGLIVCVMAGLVAPLKLLSPP